MRGEHRPITLRIPFGQALDDPQTGTDLTDGAALRTISDTEGQQCEEPDQEPDEKQMKDHLRTDFRPSERNDISAKIQPHAIPMAPAKPSTA